MRAGDAYRPPCHTTRSKHEFQGDARELNLLEGTTEKRKDEATGECSALLHRCALSDRPSPRSSDGNCSAAPPSPSYSPTHLRTYSRTHSHEVGMGWLLAQGATFTATNDTWHSACLLMANGVTHALQLNTAAAAAAAAVHRLAACPSLPAAAWGPTVRPARGMRGGWRMRV